jgi:glycosyltransferase involved in cell wall biosynthesis
MYAAGQLGIPFSFTGHANDIFQRRALLAKKLRRAAFVACISQWHREFYESIDATDAEKYRVIRCGVDWTPRGDSDSPSGAIARANVFRLLTVCRLVEKKGVDTLLRAMAICRRSGLDCRLTVAGDGPDRDRLKKISLEAGVDGSVQWLGAVDNERVRRLLGACDAFVLACRNDSSGDRDGIPVVLMEAMACGVPAVSGDLPAIRELISDGQTGLLAPGDDAEALAERLRRLAVDGELRRRLAEAGRQRVEQEFSLDLNIDRLEAGFAAAAGYQGDRIQAVGGGPPPP